MSTSEERRQLTSPFLDEELFVTDAGREWEPRLAVLERASPFLTQRDQPQVPPEPEDPEEREILDHQPRWFEVDDVGAEESEPDLDVAARNAEEMFEGPSDEAVERYFKNEDPSYEHLTDDESEAIGSEADWIESEDETHYPTQPTLYDEDEARCVEEIPYADDELSDETSHLEPADQEGETELFEPEEGDDIPNDVATFATELGAEWSQRRNGTPSATEMTTWLLQDYRDTLVGARRRWHGKGDTALFGAGKFTREAIGRAWMISRREQMAFQTSLEPTIRPLLDFKPPADSVQLISSRFIELSDKAPVAPIVGQFVEILRGKYLNAIRVSTYKGHGGGQFNNRGYSIDLFLEGRDDRGFYPRDASLGLLRAVQEAAHAVRAEWRIIYNDFAVADIINRETGKRRVIFVGTVRRPRKQGPVTGLNWHGPDPLILHFHLDLVPRTSVSSPADIVPAVTLVVPKQEPAPRTGKAPPELVRFVQQVLNSAEGEKLVVDGAWGPMTRGALERFRRKYGLGTGSVLDARTELALTQSALEELAQQSIFTRLGFRDARTEQAIMDFRGERGLGFSPAVDAQTRAALSAALDRRVSPQRVLARRPMLQVKGEAFERQLGVAPSYDDKLDEALTNLRPARFRSPVALEAVPPGMFDTSNWERKPDTEEPRFRYMLVLRPGGGRTPSRAIREIVDRSADRWTLDCAFFVQIVHLYALSQTDPIGFDRRWRNREFRLRFHGSSGASDGYIEYNFVRKNNGDRWRAKYSGAWHILSARWNDAAVLSKLKKGARVMWTNETQPRGSSLRNENTVKAGDDRYRAFGFGPYVDPKDLTGHQVTLLLAAFGLGEPARVVRAIVDDPSSVSAAVRTHAHAHVFLKEAVSFRRPQT